MAHNKSISVLHASFREQARRAHLASNTTYYVRDNTGKLIYEQVPNGTKYWYLTDAKGSVVGLVKPDGTLAGGTTYTYDPYGNLTQGQTSIDNPWLFQGQYNLFKDQGSNFGLYHMGARFYDPTIERWTQQDPAVSGGSALDQNRYLFAADNPISNTDPSGRDVCQYNPQECGLSSWTGGNCTSAALAGAAAVFLGGTAEAGIHASMAVAITVTAAETLTASLVTAGIGALVAGVVIGSLLLAC